MEDTTIVTIGAIVIASIPALIIGVKYLTRPSAILKKSRSKIEAQNIFIKKYKEADIEQYRTAFYRVGLITSAVLISFAFNYPSVERDVIDYTPIYDTPMVDEWIPNTQHIKEEETVPEENHEIEVVDDQQEIDPPAEIIDPEVDDTDESQPSVGEILDIIPIDEPDDMLPIDEDDDLDMIHIVVEQQPEFPGGREALMQYLYSRINYPPIAVENGVEGIVVVRFVVSETGEVSDIEILKDIGAFCGQEAARVVEGMPTWQPGKQRGRAVKVYFTLPVNFELN